MLNLILIGTILKITGEVALTTGGVISMITAGKKISEKVTREEIQLWKKEVEKKAEEKTE